MLYLQKKDIWLVIDPGAMKKPAKRVKANFIENGRIRGFSMYPPPLPCAFYSSHRNLNLRFSFCMLGFKDKSLAKKLFLQIILYHPSFRSPWKAVSPESLHISSKNTSAKVIFSFKKRSFLCHVHCPCVSVLKLEIWNWISNTSSVHRL